MIGIRFSRQSSSLLNCCMTATIDCSENLFVSKRNLRLSYNADLISLLPLMKGETSWQSCGSTAMSEFGIRCAVTVTCDCQPVRYSDCKPCPSHHLNLSYLVSSAVNQDRLEFLITSPRLRWNKWISLTDFSVALLERLTTMHQLKQAQQSRETSACRDRRDRRCRESGTVDGTCK